MTTIAIGSTNPAKRLATESALKKLGITAIISTYSAPSGVRDQPLSDNETILGATNRANAAREVADADYGIGLEGGVQDTQHGLFQYGWAVVVTRDRQVGVGGSPRFLLPATIADRVRAGEELGKIMDDVHHRVGNAKGEGAFGIYTGGLITRDQAFELALIAAFAPLRSELYR